MKVMKEIFKVIVLPLLSRQMVIYLWCSLARVYILVETAYSQKDSRNWLCLSTLPILASPMHLYASLKVAETGNLDFNQEISIFWKYFHKITPCSHFWQR